MANWSATQEFYESASWQALSKSVRVRDRWTCQECGFRATTDWERRRMQAHHVVSRPHVRHRTALDVMSNLVCVCRDCHDRIHGRVRTERRPHAVRGAGAVVIQFPRRASAPAIAPRPPQNRPLGPPRPAGRGRGRRS